MALIETEKYDRIEIRLHRDPGEIVVRKTTQVINDHDGAIDPDTNTVMEPTQVGGPAHSYHDVTPEDALGHPAPEVQVVGAVLAARQFHGIEEVRDALLPALMPLTVNPNPEAEPPVSDDPTPPGPAPEPETSVS